MARIIVTARADGRGGFAPFATHGPSHAGESVWVGGVERKVSSDGRVNIPASIMENVGIPGPDGRYRVAVQVGARTDAGEVSVGLAISRPPERMAGAASGEVVPRTDAVAGDVIFPSDTEEFYFKD